MKLFITGGTGFFGRSILRYLQNKFSLGAFDMPKLVVVLTRDPERFLFLHPEFKNLAWLQFHRGDIGSPAELPFDIKFTHVLHAAADSTEASKMSNLDRYRQIVDGTRNILDFAVLNGTKKFLLTSSGGAYGQQPSNLLSIPETYCGMPNPLNAHNAYGVGKRECELLCTLYNEQFGLQCVIARCFAFVGPDLPLDAHFAIGNFIRDALHENVITVSGDGSPFRSYLYQQDLAHWLFHMLLDGAAGQAYNVGSDKAISIADLAKLVRDQIAPQKEVIIRDKVKENLERNRYIPNIQKAKIELGLSVSIQLSDAVRLTAMRHIK